MQNGLQNSYFKCVVIILNSLKYICKFDFILISINNLFRILQNLYYSLCK